MARVIKIDGHIEIFISGMMDMVDLPVRKPKLNEVNIFASPQKCKVKIKNDIPIDVV